MILTFDIGNSRVKCALWQDDVIVSDAAIEYHADDFSNALDALLDALVDALGSSGDALSLKASLSGEGQTGEILLRVFAVCVAGGAPRAGLSDWVRSRWSLDVEFLLTEAKYRDKSQTVINAYADPAKLGADRWAALVAAHQLYPDSAVCVISAGTAITIDLLRRDGQHLGGYILPSFASMHAALLADTTDVVSTPDMQFKTQAKARGFPVNTNDAVNQGLHRLLRAGLCEICSCAKEELRETEVADEVVSVVTGGFAPVILDYPSIPAMRYHPDLVMRGLYQIMQQQCPGVSD
jgi:type III pantothenate kinase